MGKDTRYREQLVAPLVKPLARRLTDNGIAGFRWLSRRRCVFKNKVLCGGLHTGFVDSVGFLRLLDDQGSACYRTIFPEKTGFLLYVLVQAELLMLPDMTIVMASRSCHVTKMSKPSARTYTCGLMLVRGGKWSRITAHRRNYTFVPGSRGPCADHHPVAEPSSQASESSRDPSSSRTCVGVDSAERRPSSPRVGDMEALHTFAPHEMKQ